MTTRERGKLTIESHRQIVANLAQLLIDDEEVVDEPFGGRRDPLFLEQRLGDGAVRGAQDGAVFLDPRQESAPRFDAADDALRRSETRRVLVEPFDAEQFGTDRIFERFKRRKEDRDRDAHRHS